MHVLLLLVFFVAAAAFILPGGLLMNKGFENPAHDNATFWWFSGFSLFMIGALSLLLAVDQFSRVVDGTGAFY